MAGNYDAIESGEKRTETRKISPKYISMLRDKKPVAVRLTYGYTPRQMVWEVESVEEECVYFGINLGKRLM